jgi:hypothetical protein
MVAKHEVWNPYALVAFASGIALALISTLVFQTWRADAFPGEFDATFRPMSPCRLIDTRPGDNHVGPVDTFGADETVVIQARGDNGNCVGIPTDAIGLSLNVTAIGATLPTFLTFFPGGTRPEASSLNPVPGQPPTPNAVTTELRADGTFQVYNKQGDVDIIIDVNGFYTAASLSELLTRIASAESKIEALEAADDTFLLESQRTTAAYDGGNSSVALTNTAKTVATVTVDQATSGRVILSSSATVHGDVTQGHVQCSITTGTVVDSNYRQEVETLTDDKKTISGDRGYVINQGNPFTPDEDDYRLVCLDVNGNPTLIIDANLTAVFVPDPAVFKKVTPGF